MENLKSSFTQVAVLEINMMKGFGSEPAEFTECIAQRSPTDIQRLVLAAGKRLTGEPRRSNRNGRLLKQPQVLCEDADFLKLAGVSGNGGTRLGEFQECVAVRRLVVHPL